MAKKKVKKATPKKAKQSRPTQTVVVRVQHSNLPAVIPTEKDLYEPEKEGKKLTIPKTWLASEQIIKMVQRTPKEHVYKRKGKGGKEFAYVTGAYVQRVLNFTFGWNWDFDVIEHGIAGELVWVRGRLTVRGTKPGQEISKSQFGRAEIKFKRDAKHTPENYVDFGNDLKAATTDAFKKCASMLGIASDIYGVGEYKEETGNDPRPSTSPTSTPPVAQVVPDPEADRNPELLCNVSGCGVELSRQEYDYSKRLYGRPLCREHQKTAKKK